MRTSTLSLLLVGCLAACGGKSTKPAAPLPTPDDNTPAAGPTEPPPAVGKPKDGLIPRAVLFGNPERGAPQLSPDGKWIAFSAPASGVMNVFVAPAGDLAKAVQVTRDDKRPVRSYFWSSDGKWLLYMQDLAGDENFHLFRVAPDGSNATDLTDVAGVRAELFGGSHKHKGSLLIGLNDRNPALHDVYRLEIATGVRTLVLENPGYVGFTADDDLTLRFAQQYRPDGGVDILALGPKGATPYESIPAEDGLTTSINGFERTGKRYYMIDSRNRNTSALYAVDAKTKKATLIAENPKADLVDSIVDPKTDKVRAVAFAYAQKEWKVLDKSIAKDMAALAKLDEGQFSVISMTDDDKTWLVAYAGDRRPSRFWRWDRKTAKGTFLYSSRPALDDLELARMTPEIIRSRDGLELVSYLSLPPATDADADGRPAAPVPLVLLVHGGPWARDFWGYSPIAQLLANRGYAALSVNFRGSTGFGKSFTNAGNLQWGKAMHDDLLDAVAWAVESKVTTPDQICIMGGSYGGYATLAGLTLTPEVFKCGVDIVGPSNLITLLSSIPPYWAPIISVFKTRVGDPDTADGKALLVAASPLTHADKIVRPLLIGQGANDPRVKQAESDQIVTAMKAKQIPVSYVLFPDEGHGFARPENNIAFMATAEAFLSAHLGGFYQPMTADDFAGSTIQLKAGRTGIPGLPDTVGK